jgi:hypothetical protein
VDLVKALQYISSVKDQFTSEDLKETQEILADFELSLSELSELYERLDGQRTGAFVQLIAQYEIIKKDILERF